MEAKENTIKILRRIMHMAIDNTSEVAWTFEDAVKIINKFMEE